MVPRFARIPFHCCHRSACPHPSPYAVGVIGPVPCFAIFAAVLATLQTIKDEGLLARAQTIAAKVRSMDIANVMEVRGAGCLLGLVLDRPARPVLGALLEQGILSGTAADPNCLRLCPPAVMPDQGLDDLERALRLALA